MKTQFNMWVLYHLKSFLTVCFIAISFCITACDNDENNGPASREGSMTANVDGVQFTASMVSALKATDGSGEFAITIFGQSDINDQDITVGIANLTSPGSYSFTPDENSGNVAAYVRNLGTREVFFGATGTITITTLTDDFVEGTFFFEGITGIDGTTVSITEGTFSSKITHE